MRSELRSLCRIVALAFAASGIAAGGDCKLSGGKVDLNVLFLYNETDLESWKPMFTEASKLLHNASEGHLQIGTVNFYVTCQPAKDRSDIWISTGSAGASAHMGGCAVSGLHVFLSNLHKRNDAGAKGHLGLVHELGHYIFSLHDEYGGVVKKTTGEVIPYPPGPGRYMWWNSEVTLSGGGKAFFCQQSSGGSGCIMDAGTTVTLAHSRTEFCSPANHVRGSIKSVRLPGETAFTDRDISNNQEGQASKSCWEVVKQKLGITALPDPPSTTPPSGHQALVFNYMGTATRFMLTIDSSGSMAGSKIVLARTGAKIFVNNSRLPRTEFDRLLPGDQLGVVSFASSALLRQPLMALVSDADRAIIRGVIDGIAASGATNIGGGLRLSLNQLVAAGGPGCSEGIVLLSDGQHNTGEHPSGVMPDLVSRKTPVFSIGLGAGADAALLSGIAAGTGGRYYFAASEGSLPGIFAEIQSVLTGAEIIDRVKKVISEATTFTHNVYVEAGIPSASFNILGAGFSVRLISPSGQVSDAVVQAPGVTYSGDGLAQLFKVQNPEPGTWRIEIRRTGSGSGELELVISGAGMVTHLNATAPASINFAVTPAAKLFLRASLSQGPGVVGASVVAHVTRPDGSVVLLPLRDNGDPAQGDEEANDGKYAGLFTAFSGNGDYTFQVRANTEGAYLVAGEPVEPPAPPQPAIKTFRAITVTTNVLNAPVVVPGDLNGDGRVDCADIALVRASFGKRAGQPGFDPRADVNNDGIVDIRDLAFVAQKLPAGTLCP